MTEPDAIVAIWSARARAYREFLRTWPLFTRLADRLVDSLPRELDDCLDLGAGTGLASERLLARHPHARVDLVEPSEAMLGLAREALGERAAGYHLAPAEELASLGLAADACLASAAAHLFEDERVLPAVAQTLRPGGRYAFFLWGHSFESTSAAPRVDWRRYVEQALRAAGYAPPGWPPQPPQRVRSESGLRRLAERAGLALERLDVDADEVPAAMWIDFAAMSPTWIEHVPVAQRPEILAVARASTHEIERISTVRVMMGRRP